jgi:ParB/RepB/Spo0J family partition protein
VHLMPQPEETAAEWCAPSTLRPWPGNPRKNQPVKTVAESIQKYGFGSPIVARRANREIIVGHTRWMAAKKLGLSRVPVRFLDIDEKKARELALVDNRSSELADWDDSKLAEAMLKLDEETKTFLDGSEDKASTRQDLDVVDVTEAVGATFWITVRGPLQAQPDAIERLRASLEDIPGVQVELGGMA